MPTVGLSRKIKVKNHGKLRHIEHNLPFSSFDFLIKENYFQSVKVQYFATSPEMVTALSVPNKKLPQTFIDEIYTKISVKGFGNLWSLFSLNPVDYGPERNRGFGYDLVGFDNFSNYGRVKAL